MKRYERASSSAVFRDGGTTAFRKARATCPEAVASRTTSSRVGLAKVTSSASGASSRASGSKASRRVSTSVMFRAGHRTVKARGLLLGGSASHQPRRR
jgi:hypothetical protein